MNTKKAQDIFLPGALPESTYITRKTSTGFTNEERLRQTLSIRGYLTFISGQSKIGKTVLCEKVIGLNKLVEVSGSDFTTKTELWEKIGTKAGMPTAGEISCRPNKESASKEMYILTKENVIDYYIKNELVLLMDDFHYAEDDMQEFIAQQFKDAIRKGLKVVIVSLPYRRDDAIRTNPDLQGRISNIEIEMWSEEELCEIPRAGFKELGIEISEEIIELLAKESLGSPHLMQLICLNLCVLYNLGEDASDVDVEMLEKAYKFSILNFDYDQIAETIRQGKNSRGKDRKRFRTCDGRFLDLYELILEAITMDPPITRLGFEELSVRINKLIANAEKKPAAQSIKDYLKNLQEVLDGKSRFYRVIEWKDNTLFILEPLFLFYLRWWGVK